MRLGLVQAHLAKGGKTTLKGGNFYEKGGKKGKNFFTILSALYYFTDGFRLPFESNHSVKIEERRKNNGK